MAEPTEKKETYGVQNFKYINTDQQGDLPADLALSALLRNNQIEIAKHKMDGSIPFLPDAPRIQRLPKLGGRKIRSAPPCE